MKIITLMVVLIVIVAGHPYHGLNNKYRYREEELLNTKHPQWRNFRHALDNHRRVKLIPKNHGYYFKTKHLYQDLPAAEKIQANHGHQKKTNRQFNHRNSRQSSNNRDYHMPMNNRRPQPVKMNEYGQFPAIRPNTPLLKRNPNLPVTSSKMLGSAFGKNFKPFNSFRNPFIANVSTYSKMNGYGQFPAVRPNTPLLKENPNLPVTNNKIPGDVFSKNLKPYKSLRSPLIMNPSTRLDPNLQANRFNEVRPKRTEEIAEKSLHSEKKSPLSQLKKEEPVFWIEIFFIGIPLASVAAGVFVLASHCWEKRSKSRLGLELKADLEPTIAPALVKESVPYDIQQSNLSKTECEIRRNFVTNEIDADGDSDNVGRRLKLERWRDGQYPKPNYPEIREKTKPRSQGQGKQKDAQPRKNKGSTSESNNPHVPNPRMSPTTEPLVDISSGQVDESNDSKYPVAVNTSNEDYSLRTFDSHINNSQAKDNEKRKRSKSKMRKDKRSKDSGNKYSSEPFGVYDHKHKSRKL